MPSLSHIDRAWASTVHAFQGRTVDNVIAAMEARHPNLTTQKSFYVEISRARDRAELVTDDAEALREQLEAVTGERISALEGIGEKPGLDAERAGKAHRPGSRNRNANPWWRPCRLPRSSRNRFRTRPWNPSRRSMKWTTAWSLETVTGRDFASRSVPEP